MYHYEKKDRKSLGAQTEDELMKYILQEPIKTRTEKFQMNLSWQRNSVWDGVLSGKQ